MLFQLGGIVTLLVPIFVGYDRIKQMSSEINYLLCLTNGISRRRGLAIMMGGRLDRDSVL